MKLPLIAHAASCSEIVPQVIEDDTCFLYICSFCQGLSHLKASSGNAIDEAPFVIHGGVLHASAPPLPSTSRLPDHPPFMSNPWVLSTCTLGTTIRCGRGCWGVAGVAGGVWLVWLVGTVVWLVGPCVAGVGVWLAGFTGGGLCGWCGWRGAFCDILR